MPSCRRSRERPLPPNRELPRRATKSEVPSASARPRNPSARTSRSSSLLICCEPSRVSRWLAHRRRAAPARATPRHSTQRLARVRPRSSSSAASSHRWPSRRCPRMSQKNHSAPASRKRVRPGPCDRATRAPPESCQVRARAGRATSFDRDRLAPSRRFRRAPDSVPHVADVHPRAHSLCNRASANDFSVSSSPNRGSPSTAPPCSRHRAFRSAPRKRKGSATRVSADSRGRLLVPAIYEYRHPIEERLLRLVEQLVTPTDCSAERPVPLRLVRRQ